MEETGAQEHDEVTGLILIGGKSSRMGRDKAFLEVGGVTMFDRLLGLFRQHFRQILLAGDRPERFAGYRVPVIPDLYPGTALGGLYTGLYHAPTDYVFVASCDLPFPNGEILDYLVSLRQGFDVVVLSRPEGYEPLFAVYSKACLPAMKEQMESGDFCAFGYYPRVRTRYVCCDEIARFDPEGKALINVNTREEFTEIGGKL
jgi:molybdopterin-guanine dinucleotide biosynthesis protein A